MNILTEIIDYKRELIALRKEIYPVKQLERSIFFESPCVSLESYLRREDKNGIIAEFKRKSPSKGIINEYADVEKTSIAYMQNKVSALSILTDEKYFGGKNEDLSKARLLNYCPILRKDFVVDEYQIIEAKSIGADAILLIAAVLTSDEIRKFTEVAHSLGLEVLLEIHAESEMRKIHSSHKLVGINNRNLKNFKVDLEHSINLANQLPKNVLKIAESGIKSANDIRLLRENNFEGFLIGEKFMSDANPSLAVKTFCKDLNLSSC